MEIPNLSGVADPDVVSQKGTGNFTADYINWSRTLQDIRDNAPGWMPEMVENTELASGAVTHSAPDGSKYLMIRFVHTDGSQTTCVPHAIMDARMKPLAGDMVGARDISDAFVRGACKAAAALFGYAWQMWSKDDPMERSPQEQEERMAACREIRKQAEEQADEAHQLAAAAAIKEGIIRQTLENPIEAEESEALELWRECQWPGQKKHKGETIGHIADSDPSYLTWVNNNIFDKLDTSTQVAVEQAIKSLNDNGKQDFDLAG